MKNWSEDDDYYLLSRVYAGGTWDEVAGGLGCTPVAAYTRLLKVPVEEYNSVSLARILNVSPSTTLVWLKKGFFGPCRDANSPIEASKRRVGKKFLRILKDNLVSFLADPWYGKLYNPERVAQDFKKYITPFENWFSDVDWFVETCGVSRGAVKRWFDDEYFPALILPGKHWATPRVIGENHARLYLESDFSFDVIKKCNWAMLREAYNLDRKIRAQWRRPLGMNRDQMIRMVIKHNGRF